jgi:hypothetical protein
VFALRFQSQEPDRDAVTDYGTPIQFEETWKVNEQSALEINDVRPAGQLIEQVKTRILF